MVIPKGKIPFSKATREVLEWLFSIATALIFVTILFTYVFRVVGVSGSSMYPTFKTGDRVIISSLFYTPKRGDIIVTTQTDEDDKPLIKRIIALGGQTVRIDGENGDVYVDGVKIDEPYISGKTFETGDMEGELVVPEGEVFVMGDNRAISWDSRFSAVGTIDERYILGKVYLKVWPVSEIELY